MRYVLLGGVGLALLAAALAWTFIANEGGSGPRGSGPVATVPAGPAPPVPPPLAAPGAGAVVAPAAPLAAPAAQPAAAGAPVAAPAAMAPSFDVVRIKPNGDAVFAGRAAPGAKVQIVDGGRVIGETTADPRGEWVYLPTVALPPGSRELGLSARHADGTVIESAAVVVLHVPDRAKPADSLAAVQAPAATPAPAAAPAPAATLAQVQPAAGSTAAIPVPATPAPQGVVAVATPRSGEGPSRVLQIPGDGAKGDAAGVSVDVVDYDEKGDLILSGRGAAGSNVTVYLNNQPIGQATVDKAKQWQMKPAQPVQPGQYQMRADETSPQGKVSSRIELPFMRAETQRPATAGETRIIVQPGNSLWRIARHRYGEGQRFSVIYSANKDQIRDPNLIYPGQVFAMPTVN
ncbi:MAG: LysM peptidoglycan-binding domain-containing protein [Rhodospirillales bacterium]|nr:LysM peptidoglycan-binding domain-containing protein [Rhodospirillales bacterium]